MFAILRIKKHINSLRVIFITSYHPVFLIISHKKCATTIWMEWQPDWKEGHSGRDENA